jgi:hypothetical protein
MAIVTVGTQPLTLGDEPVTIGIEYIPKILVARDNVPFSSFEGMGDGVALIYKVGTPLKSYRPGRDINGITAFEVNGGYYVIMKWFFDFGTAVYSPPDEA